MRGIEEATKSLRGEAGPLHSGHDYAFSSQPRPGQGLTVHDSRPSLYVPYKVPFWAYFQYSSSYILPLGLGLGFGLGLEKNRGSRVLKKSSRLLFSNKFVFEHKKYHKMYICLKEHEHVIYVFKWLATISWLVPGLLNCNSFHYFCQSFKV